MSAHIYDLQQGLPAGIQNRPNVPLIRRQSGVPLTISNYMLTCISRRNTLPGRNVKPLGSHARQSLPSELEVASIDLNSRLLGTVTERNSTINRCRFESASAFKVCNVFGKRSDEVRLRRGRQRLRPLTVTVSDSAQKALCPCSQSSSSHPILYRNTFVFT